MIWLAHLACGFGVGFLSFMLIVCEDKFTEWRCKYTQQLIDTHDNVLVASYFFWALSGTGLVLIATLLTIYVGPGAYSSGVAEVMGMLNGVNYKGAISFRTLFVKCFGTLFAVVGGLCIGKEGPLVHIGATIGILCCYIPFPVFKYMQNDVHKRQMIACGGACGLSVAFGSPIGGALFAYEISKPSSFWTFSMLWRVFTATSVSTFTLALLESMYTGAPLSLSDSGSIKFGQVQNLSENTMLDLPAAIILGIICGLLGALFIYISVAINIYRKKYITSNFRKIAECVLFGFITASCFYGVVVLRKNNCKLREGTVAD